jgi:type I restriction enzyme S subunit
MIETWKKILLKDACKVFADGDWIESKDQSPDGIRLVQTGNIGFGYFKDKEDKSRYISEETFFRLKCTEILPGDLLVSRLPDPVGKSCIIPEINSKMITGVDCTIIRPKDNLSSEFLCYYQMSNQYLNDVQSGVSGATRQRISRKNLGLIEIPLPPLSEQQYIVAILDEAFAAIAKAKANAEQNLKNAKELFESYLQGVFENKGEGWVSATIGETCNLQTGGTPSTSKKEFYVGGTIKWLVSGDINQKIINDCEGRITDLGMNSSNTKYLPINSVLIALNGQGKTRGTVAMLRTKATCNQSLVSIFPKDEKILLPELVFSNLEGRYDEIRKMTGDGGNDRRGLNMPLIRSIKFSYPKNITEQKEIIKKLENLRAETKKLETIYNLKINDLEELKKSVLQKAFAGELKTEKV